MQQVATEAQEQTALFEWCERMKAIYPQLLLLFAIPNGGSRHPAEAKHLKQQGVKAGVPDLFLPIARAGYHGLFLEMKRTKGGRISDEQKAWIKNLLDYGYMAKVCYGWEQAADLLLRYLVS